MSSSKPYSLTTLLSQRNTPRSACSSESDGDGIKLSYVTVGGEAAILEFHKIRLSSAESIGALTRPV